MRTLSYAGILVAILVIGAWLTSIILLLRWEISLTNPLTYVFILVQMHLYTGLFITAHDAMHGTVSSNKPLNNFIGQLCTALYAVFPFQKLNTKHHQHHKFVHTDKDPDHFHGSFIAW